ncbi:MAG: hypothetical protein L0227_14710 [Chloroflexi bacterium]|nr:hypothetical protein [Chloroflexota bacterium]
MAIPTFVNAGTFVAAASGSISPGLPAGWAVDDIHILVMESRSNESGQSLPTGYSHVSGSSIGTPTTPGTRLHVAWRRAQSGDAAPSITILANHLTARIFGFRGCVTTGDPWDVTATGTNDTSSSGSKSIPGATTTVADTLVAAIIASGADVTSSTEFSAWANADLAAVTERGDDMSLSGGGGGTGLATGEKATAGTYAATTVTVVSAERHAFLSIALKPPPGGLPWRSPYPQLLAH